MRTHLLACALLFVACDDVEAPRDSALPATFAGDAGVNHCEGPPPQVPCALEYCGTLCALCDGDGHWLVVFWDCLGG